MFFRTKFINGTPLVQLVHAYRNDEGLPRQRVLVSLGAADIPEGEKHRIARAVEQYLEGTQDLLVSDLSQEATVWVARIVQLLGRSKAAKPPTGPTVDGVILNNIDTSDNVQLGPQLVALEAWKALGFTPMLQKLGLNASRIATAQLMVANRLIAPLSEWALIDWAQRTALPEILGVRLTKSTKDRLYHTSDDLLEHRKAIEAALRTHEADIFSLNITRGSRTKYAQAFESEAFEALPGRKAEQKVEVRQIADPEDPEGRLVLCRSAQRRLKEEAMVSKAEARFLAGVKALRERIETGRFKKPGVIAAKIDALLKKHPRLARLYTLDYREGTLSTVRDEEKMRDALSLCGDYVLKTDKSLEAPQLWSLYMTLLKAEEGFQMLKGSLGLRPNYHQLEDRVDGHIFISVLAYHLLCWVRRKLDPLGDLRDWISLRRLLGTHSLTTISMPLVDGRIIQIRKAGVPDAEQAQVYKSLGIDWKNAFPPRKSVMKA